MITKISKELLIRRISIAPCECQLQVCYYSAFNSSSKWCSYSNCGNGSGFPRTAFQRLWTTRKWLTLGVEVTRWCCPRGGWEPASRALLLPLASRASLCHRLLSAPSSSPARQSEIQILNIPPLVFMEAHTMKLNSSQCNRAPETGWSFLWASSLWWANLEEIHSEYDFFSPIQQINQLNHLLTLISYRNRPFNDSAFVDIDWSVFLSVCTSSITLNLVNFSRADRKAEVSQVTELPQLPCEQVGALSNCFCLLSDTRAQAGMTAHINVLLPETQLRDKKTETFPKHLVYWWIDGGAGLCKMALYY